MEESITGKILAQHVREGLRDGIGSWAKTWRVYDGEVKLTIERRNGIDRYVFIKGLKNDGSTFCNFCGCYDSKTGKFDVDYEYVSEEKFYSVIEALLGA